MCSTQKDSENYRSVTARALLHLKSKPSIEGVSDSRVLPEALFASGSNAFSSFFSTEIIK